MSKVYLGVGHGGSDSGAVKYVVEKDVNLKMALACKEYLEANGVEVKISRTTDIDKDLTARIKECNAYDPDLAIDIHNNAGGGDGFEVFHTIYGGTGKTLAQNIEAEVKAIGQNSRGLKTKKNSSGKDYFGFIRQISCPSIITEGVFVDNKNDAAQADTLAEQKAFGVAIAKGVLKTLGKSVVKDIPTNSASVEDENKKVIKNLQHAYNVSYNTGLAEDGIKGPKTEAAMKKYVLVNYTANELARWVQDRLVNHKGYSLKIDGKFGNESEAVTREFQRDNNLSADGKAGIKTISILI